VGSPPAQARSVRSSQAHGEERDIVRVYGRAGRTDKPTAGGRRHIA
jgi:hypothetical protein